MKTNIWGPRVMGIFLVPLALAAGAISVRAEQPVVVQPVVVQPAVVQPVTPVQVQPAPVQAVPTTQKTVTVEDRPQNFMATIAKSTFFGAVTGALIGGAIYFIDSPRRDPEHIGYWAAGGALFGAGVGLVNVAVNQEHSERAVARLDSAAGRSFGLRLATFRF